MQYQYIHKQAIYKKRLWCQMKVAAISILFISGHAVLKAQIPLQQILSTANDSVRIFKLSDAAFELSANQPDSALKLSNIELAEANKTKKPLLIANALNDIATSHYYLSNFDSCIWYSRKAFQLRKTLNRPDLEISSLNKIGISFQETGRLKEAADIQFQILSLSEKINNTAFMASTCNNLAFLFYHLKDYATSLRYSRQSYKYAKISDSRMVMAEALGSMANVYEIEEKYDSAIVMLKQAADIFKQEKNLKSLASSFQAMGIIYRKLNKDKEGLQYYYDAYNTSDFAGNNDDKAHYAADIASVLISQKKYTQARPYLYESKFTIEPKKNFDALKNLYPNLMFYHLYAGNKDSAAFYFEKFNEVRDSFNSIETAREVSKMNILYETEKRKARIADLNASNTRQQLSIQQRNFWLIFVLVALLSVLLGIWTYLRHLKNKQKIQLQNAIIQQQDEAAKAVVSAEENERNRMSQTLHDGLGQLLSAAKMNLQAVQDSLHLNPQMNTAYNNALVLVDDSIKEMRSVSHQMVTNNVVRTGLANALKELIEKINSNSLQVNLQVDGLLQNIDSDIQIVVYRIIQEAINNVIKHARANALDIELNMNGNKLKGTIKDNGIGFNTNQIGKMRGIGLDNIATRIKFLKGAYTLESEQGKGTKLLFEIPL